VLNAEVVFTLQHSALGNTSAFLLQPSSLLQHSAFSIQNSMNGVLVIDKPAGPTSHDVVAVARRALGGARVGHTGTLDPLATGVLPLVVGRATRLATFMTGADKEYVARIRFGLATKTYDAEGITGNEERASTADLTEAGVRDALATFVGRLRQTPPPFSAKKIGGTPAYKLARRAEPVEVRPVDVTAIELELSSFADGLADVRLVCSSGFYVRSLAHDLGVRLGCGAHLEGLRRTRSGDFTLADAVTLDVIAGSGPEAARHLVPMERLLPKLPAVVLSQPGAKRVSHGGDVGPDDVVGRPPLADAGDKAERDSRFRLLDADGLLLGLAEPRAGGFLHPVLVLV
jgi:tRNA pseudouridine55 synthase